MKVVFFRCIDKLYKLIDRACAKDNNTKFVEEGNESRLCLVHKPHDLFLYIDEGVLGSVWGFS
jgi:hypothetical protein